MNKAFLLGLFVFILDFISKYLTVLYIPIYRYANNWGYKQEIPIFDIAGIQFSLSHVINRGAAWGIFADFQHYLLYLRIILIVCLIVYLCFYNKNKLWEYPLALIISGALGNIIDYFIYGHVIDMFHFVFWGFDFAVFNLADCAISLGIAWILLISWQSKKAHNFI